MKQVTLKQIAERAATSVGTVDRALNNRGRISPETKKKILTIAEELGYQPNKIASALSRGRSYRIAVLYPRFPGYFVDEMTEGLQKAIDHFSHYKLEIVPFRCDHLNPQSQLDAIRMIDFSSFDGFCLNASGEELSPYIDEIVDMNIPVATFNSDIHHSKRLFHVGMDAFMSGRVACDLMGKMMQGKGKILAVPGYNSVISHKERIQGFLDAAQNYPDIQIIQEGEYRDSASIAEDLARDMLTKYSDITGIYTVSSPGTIGAGRYLESLPKEKRTLLVGYDTNTDIEDLLKKDICTFVIYQNPAAQIHYAVRYMAEYLLFKNLPREEMYFLPPQIVVKENIDYYLHLEDKFTFVD